MSMAKAVNEMNRSLKSDMSNSERAQKYNESLSNFQSYNKQAMPTESIVLNNYNAKEYENDQHQQVDFGTLPRTLQEPANLFMKHLNQLPKSSFEWDGQSMSINGRKMPGANIVDLISDILRNRKTPIMEETKELLKLMAKHNVPESYIRNQNVLPIYREIKNAGAPVVVKRKRSKSHSLIQRQRVRRPIHFKSVRGIEIQSPNRQRRKRSASIPYTPLWLKL